jgi:hypothetical protein
MGNRLPTKPVKHLLFRSPLPKGEGVKQALAWNREQLLDLRRLWELWRQRRIDQGQIPMTHPPTMISDAVLAVGSNENTVMATPLSSQTHHSTSPLVTDLQGPPSERTQTDKIRDLKSLAQQYARDQGSHDDTRISYLEFVESEAEADLTLARMIAG